MFNNFELLYYIKNYKFNSLFIKNLILVISLLFIPFSFILFFSYNSYDRVLKNEIGAGNVNSILKVREAIDVIISEANNQINWSGFDKDIELFLHAESGEIAIFYSLENIYKLINMHLLTKDYYDSIYIYAQRSHQIISSKGRVSLDNFIDNDWYEDYENNKGNMTSWISVRQKQEANKKNKKVISIYKTFKYSPTSKGVIIFNLDAQKLGDRLLQKAENPYERIVILDENKTFIYSSDAGNGEFNDLSVMPHIEEIKNNSTDVASRIIDKKVVSSVASQETGWVYISLAPLHYYEQNVKDIRRIMLTMLFIGIICTIIISFIVSVKTFNPIQQIISAIRQQENIFSTESNKSIKDGELKYIVESFTKSFMKEKQTSTELEKRIKLLKKYQMIALQSQINPHFFHNTLETINWMAMQSTGSNSEISRMITSLSNMLRISLENTDKLIPFNLEREHVSQYIFIQKVRYDNKFNVVWRIHKEIDTCSVIKIILQPIVENAIYHGIKPITGQGIIHITGYKEDNYVYIEVKDNGIGMSQEKLDMLNEEIENKNIKENEHLGLMNVNQRLKLFFGEDCGVTVESKQMTGTTVTLKMPFII